MSLEQLSLATLQRITHLKVQLLLLDLQSNGFGINWESFQMLQKLKV